MHSKDAFVKTTTESYLLSQPFTCHFKVGMLKECLIVPNISVNELPLYSSPNFLKASIRDKYEIENGSLIMWRGYGKDNGCAIVFDKDKLVALANTLSRNSNAISTVDGEVSYPENIEELKTIYSKEYRLFVDYTKHIAEESWNLGGRPFYDEVEEGLTPYIKMKALTKHHAFKSENEYRLSMLRSIPTINGTDKNLMPVENGIIKLPIASDGIPIKKIIVSPFSNQDKNHKILQDFIKSSPQYLNIRITKSAIPHT